MIHSAPETRTVHSAPETRTVPGGSGNSTYTPVTLTKTEIINNQTSVLSAFGIETSKEDHELPSMYWLPKLHKSPYKQRYIAGSSKCSTKQISILLTKILTVIKEGLETYSDTAFSRNGMNQMWILKTSKTLLDNLKSRSLRKVSSISTLFQRYTQLFHMQN